jgi:hypothetical protein
MTTALEGFSLVATLLRTDSRSLAEQKNQLLGGSGNYKLKW